MAIILFFVSASSASIKEYKEYSEGPKRTAAAKALLQASVPKPEVREMLEQTLELPGWSPTTGIPRLIASVMTGAFASLFVLIWTHLKKIKSDLASIERATGETTAVSEDIAGKSEKLSARLDEAPAIFADKLRDSVSPIMSDLTGLAAAVSDSQRELVSLAKLVSAEHQILRNLGSLQKEGVPDSQLQEFVSTCFSELSETWVELLTKLDLVGAEARQDRHFWQAVLSQYIKEEVKHLKGGIVATNVSLYLRMVQVLTSTEEAGVRPCFFVVNTVLPEHWYNWPCPSHKGESSFYAPPWLQEFRETVSAVARRGDIEIERITLVWDEVQVDGLSPLKDLREQADLCLHGTEPVTMERLRQENRRTAVPPGFPETDAAWYIAADPTESLGPRNLLEAFINELHPSSESAQYCVVGREDIEPLRQENPSFPTEFVLAGWQTPQGEVDWAFAVGADEVNFDHQTVLMGLYGILPPRSVDLLKQWRTALKTRARPLRELLKP